MDACILDKVIMYHHASKRLALYPFTKDDRTIIRDLSISDRADYNNRKSLANLQGWVDLYYDVEKTYCREIQPFANDPCVHDAYKEVIADIRRNVLANKDIYDRIVAWLTWIAGGDSPMTSSDSSS